MNNEERINAIDIIARIQGNLEGYVAAMQEFGIAKVAATNLYDCVETLDIVMKYIKEDAKQAD